MDSQGRTFASEPALCQKTSTEKVGGHGIERKKQSLHTRRIAAVWPAVDTL